MGDPLDAIRPTWPNIQSPKLEPSGRLCARRGCKGILDPVITGKFHPNCEPGMKFVGSEPDATNHPYRTMLIDAILNHDASRARSQQVEMGPSELGAPCERLLAYKLVGTKPINRFNDPWPAIVGTALHAHLEQVLDHYNRTVEQRFLTERKVAPDPMVKGTADAYDMIHRRVLDWKSMGRTKEHELDEKGPPWGYYVQIQLYGLGYVLAGYPVDTVGLFFVPRAGYLKRSARYYEWPYDEQVAREAIARIYRIGGQLMHWYPTGQDLWSQVPADGGRNCGFCPFYRKPASEDEVATATGCPGR